MGVSRGLLLCPVLSLFLLLDYEEGVGGPMGTAASYQLACKYFSTARARAFVGVSSAPDTGSATGWGLSKHH